MFIINLQFWDGDKHQAMEVAKLIADLEPKYRDDVTFLFSARFDCQHDQAIVEHVSKKFPTLKHTTRRMGTGWPNGCNDLMSDSYQFCIDEIAAGKIKAEAILFVEADAIPLDPDWINKLKAEYKACGKMVLGAWLMVDDCGVEHINGNCLIHKDFWKHFPEILQTVPGAWDGWNPGPILAQGAPSKLIFSDYHLGTDRNPWSGECTELWRTRQYHARNNPLYGQNLNPVWLHGPKDLRGIACVRSRFLPNLPNVRIDHTHFHRKPNRGGVCHRGH